jgi:hypothetical protein
MTWDSVPGAISYNIYTIGTSDVFFDSSPTNTYTFKFNPSSSWYFKVAAVDASGNESDKTNPVTIAFPSSGVSLEIPQNLRITQVETTQVPTIKKVHILWDPVEGATSYIIYTNAGTTYYYYATVDTNLYEMNVNVNSTFYIAVSGVRDSLESARSQVLTIDISNTITQTPTPTTPVLRPTPTVSDDSIYRLKNIEQDVKNLKTDVQIQKKQQQETQGLLEKIVTFLRRIFGFGS